MELRYCEECGNAHQVELGKPFSITDRFVCEPCKQGGPGSKKAKEAKRGSTRFGNVLEDDSLNLFSSQTIAFHKQKQDGDTPQKPKSSRLRLVKPGSASLPAPTTGQTTAAPQAPSSASARVASSPADPANATTSPGAAVGAGGSTAPARSARKILFRCLHCRSTLSIRPVEQTSKLVCPQCSKEIYVTSSGRLLKTSPSAVVRKDPAGVPQVPGSIRVAKKGSTVQLRSQPAPAKAAPGSSKIQPLIPGGSVRLTRVHPGAPLPAQKPCSAFEEHQARQDPEKTVFITEEPLEDLSQLASSDVVRNVAQNFVRIPSIEAPPESPVAGPLYPDESDLLENEEAYVSVSAAIREDTLVPEAPAAPKENSAPRHEGLAQRVLRALFSP